MDSDGIVDFPMDSDGIVDFPMDFNSFPVDFNSFPRENGTFRVKKRIEEKRIEENRGEFGTSYQQKINFLRLFFLLKIFMKKIAKKKLPPEPHFNSLVGVWFEVYCDLIPPEVDKETGKVFCAKPIFDGPESRNMKLVVADLRKRAEERDVVWTEEEAKKRFEAFLRKSFEDDFISKNFMLRIINNNKTKIFNNQITRKKNVSQENWGSNTGEIYDQL